MKKIFLILILIFAVSCDTSSETIVPESESEPEPEVVLGDNVEVYTATKFEESYTLAIENGGTTSYLLNKEGFKIKEWNFDASLGNDLELLDDGKLIGMFKVENPDFSFGGFGGIVKILNLDGTLNWEYRHASENILSHHDVEMLPNGNILFIAWEKITVPEAQIAGVNSTTPIYPEVLIEVKTSTNEIVWEWHSFDHIIQDQFNSISNFGSVPNNPNLIDINYNIVSNGDIMHANGLDYDVLNDVIYLSINGYSEIWVIDHSTTTLEASSNLGGNYNKGGDLLYRFGNPEAYQNTMGQRIFYNNHFPNFLEGNEPGAGNVLVFGNGSNIEQSTVYELEMPTSFNLTPNVNNEPTIIWSFMNDDLFHARISGAVRLENGNTLIAEGDYGFWEVTPTKEVVWKYNGQGANFWRCYGYKKDSNAILSLGL